MEYCRLQIGCLIVLFYVTFNYYKDCVQKKRSFKRTWFDELLLLTLICLIFDVITVYTVNHLETVPALLNRLAHMIFLGSVDALIFSLFLYMLYVTEGFPKQKWTRLLLYTPFAISIAVLVLGIGTLEYRIGRITNYSMGLPTYTCYFMVAFYLIFTLVIFFRRWNYIEMHKRASVTLYMTVLTGVSVYQMIVPEALITSIGFTVMILGIYMNQENPAIQELTHYHNEMVMGFATLVEERDDSTGGHIRRTSRYVELLARELQKRGCYKDILTKDYIQELMQAAPMHDIGKISVPDAILQKPGRLTDEEYEIMKTHAEEGGRIIKETFGNLADTQYLEVAYQVAAFHHERWNGRGYPSGLKETEIPLCARIMAVADVFDAIAEKRCYREAMPMEQCFEIIRNGRGTDFEPLLVDVFLDIRKQVEAVHDDITVARNK